VEFAIRLDPNNRFTQLTQPQGFPERAGALNVDPARNVDPALAECHLQRRPAGMPQVRERILEWQIAQIRM